PSLTLSPSLTFTASTVPANGDGTSIVALSDSSVTSASSAFTVSPGFTRMSMTGMSLKSPMSGTLTSIVLIYEFSSVGGCSSHRPRIGPLGVESVLLDRLRDDLRLQLAFVGERLQRGDGDVVAVDLEELAQLDAVVAAPEAVGAQRDVAPRNVTAHLVGVVAHVICRGNDRPGVPFERRFDVALPARLGWVQEVVPVGAHAVAAQLVEARRAPEIGVHFPVVAQQVRGRDDLAQDRAGAHELDARALIFLVRFDACAQQ